MSNNDFIGIDIHGIKQVQAALKRWPKAAVDMGADALSEFLINVLKAYPPKKSVTRQKAYGKTFFSEKQRRWFFGSGKIQFNSDGSPVPYIRTQGLANGWKQIGKGANQLIVNEREGAGFVMGDGQQSRHESMVGWLTVNETIKDHERGMIKEFVGAVKKAIRKTGLKVKD